MFWWLAQWSPVKTCGVWHRPAFRIDHQHLGSGTLHICTYNLWVGAIASQQNQDNGELHWILHRGRRCNPRARVS